VSVKKKLPLSQISAIPKKVGRDAEKAIAKAIPIMGRVPLDEAKSLTTSAGIKDTGAYLKGWKVIELGKSLQLVNTTPYAGVIEAGAKFRKMPPLKKIIPWVRRKMPDTRAIERRKIAFLIARKIKQRGLPAYNILSKTVENTSTKLRMILQLALRSGLK